MRTKNNNLEGYKEFILKWKKEKGVIPSMREIGANMRVTRQTVSEQLMRLEARGFLERGMFKVEIMKPLQLVRGYKLTGDKDIKE